MSIDIKVSHIIAYHILAIRHSSIGIQVDIGMHSIAEFCRLIIENRDFYSARTSSRSRSFPALGQSLNYLEKVSIHDSIRYMVH